MKNSDGHNPLIKDDSIYSLRDIPDIEVVQIEPIPPAYRERSVHTDSPLPSTSGTTSHDEVTNPVSVNEYRPLSSETERRGKDCSVIKYIDSASSHGSSSDGFSSSDGNRPLLSNSIHTCPEHENLIREISSMEMSGSFVDYSSSGGSPNMTQLKMFESCNLEDTDNESSDQGTVYDYHELSEAEMRRKFAIIEHCRVCVENTIDSIKKKSKKKKLRQRRTGVAGFFQSLKERIIRKIKRNRIQVQELKSQKYKDNSTEETSLNFNSDFESKYDIIEKRERDDRREKKQEMEHVEQNDVNI